MIRSPSRERLLSDFHRLPLLLPGLKITRTNLFVCFVFLGGALLCGCSVSKKKKTPQKAEARQSSAKKSDDAGTWTQTLGRVSLVNPDMAFVLVDIGTAPAPEPGASLRAYANGTASGELVVSNYQRRPFLIGDIISGMPRVGDSIVLVTKRTPSEAKNAVREPVSVPRIAADTLPQNDSRVEYLPNLIKGEPKGFSPSSGNLRSAEPVGASADQSVSRASV